jgi:23S rRNA (guanosine2251-2'-O)-methyltransferase
MIIYGMNPVREALRADPKKVRYLAVTTVSRAKLGRLVDDARAHGVEVKILTPRQIDRLAAGGVHNGVVAELSAAGYADFDEMIESEQTSFVVLLDGVQDPQNLGAVLRVADGFGADLVVLPSHDSAGITPAVVKASAGATEWVPVAQVTNLSRAIEALQARQFWVYGADGGGDPLDAIDLTGKVAIVLGNEGKGIRRNVLEHCDRTVAIPMQGRLESLNVATAAAVFGWEILRQRRKAEPEG